MRLFRESFLKITSFTFWLFKSQPVVFSQLYKGLFGILRSVIELFPSLLRRFIFFQASHSQELISSLLLICCAKHIDIKSDFLCLSYFSTDLCWNFAGCPLQCKNGGQVDRNTCTCTCYGKWKGSDCSGNKKWKFITLFISSFKAQKKTQAWKTNSHSLKKVTWLYSQRDFSCNF